LAGDQRRAPREPRLVAPPGFIQSVTQMFLDLGLVRIFFRSALEGLDRLLDLAALELRPAERIDDRRVVGRKLARLADHRFGRVDILAALELGVTEKIEEQ